MILLYIAQRVFPVCICVMQRDYQTDRWLVFGFDYLGCGRIAIVHIAYTLKRIDIQVRTIGEYGWWRERGQRANYHIQALHVSMEPITTYGADLFSPKRLSASV